MRLFGDSSCIVHYLRYLGYDLSRIEQTGSNFGTEVKHETPYLSSVGSGTMVADGLSINNADFSSTSFRVSRTSIGAQNFLGNRIAYPSRGRTGDNCLLATKVMVPIDGKVREGVGLLGSPSFEIPRSVQRDSSFDGLKSEEQLRHRLPAKNRHNAATMAWYLLVRWIYFFLVTLLVSAAADLYAPFGAAAIALADVLVVLFTAVYYVLIERAVTAWYPTDPLFCSIYDLRFWRRERYWKVPSETYLRMFDGTPFKSLIWRMLGVRIGSRVFDDGCYLTERTMVTIGDGCTLNAGSVVQCHSQEDGTFKSDRSTIGSGSTLGVGAFVHYGVAIGDGAVLAPDSFLMKGEVLPHHAWWEEIRPGRSAGATVGKEVAPMATRLTNDVVFRRDEPAAGGFATVPRWTRTPVPGTAAHESVIPEHLLPALERWAQEWGVTPHSVLLAAHARVLGALSGERTVATGYVAVAGGDPLPCRLTTAAASWRTLVRDTHQVASQLPAREGDRADGPGERRTGPFRRPRRCSIRPVAAERPKAPCCGWLWCAGTAGTCCGCTTGPMCSTRRVPPGSPATTSPRSR